MASLLYHTIIFLLLLTLTHAQVRIPITRKTHLSHPALNRRLSSRGSISVSLLNNITQESYVISVKVGTPPQDIDLIIDTGSSDTWLLAADADLCDDAELQAFYDITCSTPFYPNYSSSINQSVSDDTFDISYADGSKSIGTYITDEFILGTSTIHSLQMGLAINTSISIGIFGIGYSINEASNTVYPNIIDELISQNLISTRTYSLYLDSHTSSTGSILFGAVDTTKFIGTLVNIDMVPAPLWNGSMLYSSFDIELVGLGITDQGGKTMNFANAYDTVTLDSGTTITYLPARLTYEIYEYFKAYDDTLSSGNVYIRCSLLITSPDLTINYLFSSDDVSVTIKVPLSELIFPLTNPAYTLPPGVTVPPLPFNGEACGFGIQTGNNDVYLLGDTFLRSAYVVYDLENNQIGLAQSNFESSSTDTSSSDVELKAGETGLPALSGASLSSSATMSSGMCMSTNSVEPKPTSSGTKTGTEILAATAKPTQTGKSDGATPISRNIDLKIIGFVVLGGLMFSGGVMVM